MSTRPELKFSDTTDERSFYRKFQNLPAQPEQTLRIVDKTDYFIAVSQNAKFIAEQIYHTNSVLKNNNGVEYVTMSHAVMSNLLSMALLEKGYKIEIYDKNWELTKFASPGNIESVEDLMNPSELNQSGDALVLVSLKIVNKNEGKSIGYCFINSNIKEIGISEFLDNDLYSNLESLLIQIDAKEVLIPTPSNELDPDYTKLIGVIDRCGAVVTEIRSNDFNNKDIEQDLIRLLGDELIFSTGDISNASLGLSSASAILNYLGLLTDDSNFGSFNLKNHTLNQFMKLDSAAVKALNLFPSSKSTNGSKNSNVFDLLNHCKSIGGTRLLHQWIKQPLIEIDEILQRHQLVGCLVEDTQLRTSLHDDLMNSIPDIRKLNKKLNKSIYANLEDVVRIYQFLIKIPEILELLESKINETESLELKGLIELHWVSPLKELMNPLLKLQELVETTVDLENLDRHEFVIKPDYDEILLKYRERLDEIESTIRSIHADVADELGLDPEKKLKLELHQNHGWCMRLTRTEERSIRGKSKFIELQTVKAGVFFTTEEMKDISLESSEIQAKYNKQQRSLVKEIISITATYSPVLEKLSLILSHLDVLTSFAHVSSYAPVPYIKPKMYPLNSTEGKTIVKEARHPCVEMQDGVTFIANDVELVKNETEFLIITGPNMGGKSTYIRQIGTISLIAQIGCFVPATEAELCVFDAILARVGAGDSQLKGVSTFMMEMLETASILQTASSNSLIIIDELGRGTSTYDGFGLAWAISEFIATKLNCFTIFATHFHELTKLSDKLNKVKNLHVVAHVESNSNTSSDITLLYKVEPGISDQSFGIHVAEVVKFPGKIVSMAKRKAAELEEYNDNKQDPYVEDKRTKCSSDEISQGSELLKKILKEWRNSIDFEKISSEDAVNKLKELVNDQYKDQVENSKYIQEVLEL
ncbi:DNA mismatch repair protein [Wickerhamomyces ciferrii]|uniref:DNA mismatch repair protein MSH2 n=1 Tax=Wickerhamomyces ciferrii (strain ATCC 14091 / BCRC 22168 / CBS 111 / JCM 3599 / NBRC 0793 / NRRL Y-1031 F-60-10) TaxID=1206466 RepID=K0KSS4_WICCF|nr:DNA mismatch repair protein [Wickerhamomyces ciferrii]CCH44419.1 DNA mismatch repair protein [Wickerhamomyces ciferrii]